MRLIRLVIAGATLGSLPHSASATTVTYVGKETGGAPSYLLENWSNASSAKVHDIGNCNQYGTAGYFQIRPVIPWDAGGGVWVFDATLDGNDLGTSAGSYPTLFTMPSFLSSITGFAGTFVNFDSYSVYTAPANAGYVRQGALSVPVNQGPYNSPAGENASKVGTPLQFTLGAATQFRLGLAVDSVANGTYGPDYVSVFHANTGTVFSAALSRDGVPDMVFFDIAGNPGDQFIVGLWQNTGTESVAAVNLVTFDLLPPKLSATTSGNNIVLSWPPAVTGWVLESSTDLGLADTWDPVPGVVNNSVSVPMTDPSNFFRLKQNP